MKRRLALWAIVGFVVALSWVAISFAIPLSTEPLLWRLAQITCPIALFARYAIKWYWVVLSNGAVYLLLGLIVEGVMRLRHVRPAAA
jgi:hypothetical protein